MAGFPHIYFNYYNDCLKLMQISQWGDVTWNDMDSAFAGCSNLIITATDEATAQMGAVTNFHAAWSMCTSLTDFPLLNTAAGTDFSYAWYYATGLTFFPPLNTAAGENFFASWAECRGLTSFPLLDTGAGINFSYAWIGCAHLTSFPRIDTTAGTSFSAAWRYCGSLASFPLLDMSAGTDFSWTWAQCWNLTDFPQLNMVSGIDLSYTWYNCSSLTVFPPLDLRNMAYGDQCFAGVILSSVSYSALLTDLALNNSNYAVTFDGGFSTYDSTAASYRSLLVNTRSWNISDGGGLLLSQSISGFTGFSAHAYGESSFIISGVTGGASGEPVIFSSDNPGVATVSGTTVTITGAGTAFITAMQSGNSQYSDALVVSRSLTVDQAPLSVIADDASRPYGTANPVFTGTLTGVVNDDPITVTYASNASATTPVHVYGPATAKAIIPTLVDPGSRLGNYHVTIANGTLAITPLSQTISGFAALAAHTYGEGSFSISGVIGGASGKPVIFSSGNLAVATISGSTVTISGAGTVIITAAQAGDSIYAAALPVSQTLIIARAPLSVTAADASRVFGAANPLFTGTLMGVVNGDAITAGYVSSATATTPVGVYDLSTTEVITPTLIDPGARLSNYSVTMTRGTLTVTEAADDRSSPYESGGCGVGAMTIFLLAVLGLWSRRLR
jgi:MBG domain (YGX type)